METTPCPRCSGHGVIPCFSHVQKGVCFRCKGEGTVEVKPKAKPATKVVRRGPSEAEYLRAERAAIVADSEDAVLRMMAEEALYADYHAARECASGRP